MIRYQLQCQGGHGFEAWFGNAAAFDAQAAEGVIACPLCGSNDVSKAIMAPNLSPRIRHKGIEPQDAGSGQAMAENPASDQPASADSGQPSDASPKSAAPASQSGPDVVADSFAMQREFTEVMRKLRAEVESKAEYVGPRFAEEARKIHDEESEARGIYGEATLEEVNELNEDGVEFFPLPRLPEDNN